MLQAGSVVVIGPGVFAALTAGQKAALTTWLVPDVTVSCLITDSQTGAVLRDFSAGFSLFDIFRLLSAAQRLEAVEHMVMTVIRQRAGF